MFRDVFLAQFWFTLRRPLLYLFCAFMAFSSYDFSSNIDPRHTNIIPIGDLWHNSPYLIARYLLFMGIFGFLFITVPGRSGCGAGFQASLPRVSSLRLRSGRPAIWQGASWEHSRLPLRFYAALIVGFSGGFAQRFRPIGWGPSTYQPGWRRS